MFDLHKTMSDVRIVAAMIFLVASSGVNALNDPTRPFTYHSTGKTQALKLESTLISSNRKIAVVNGSVVAEGERVKDFTIIEIRKDSVKGQLNGKIVTLKLDHTEIRRKN